jgi:3-methyladenine DNA glycosylase AlkD
VTAKDFMRTLATYASPERAANSAWFFKTGEGQYGAGDQFAGVRVPDIRTVCKQFAALPLPEIQKLLDSAVHEHRLAAVIILSNQYKKADEAGKKAIYDLYLKNVYDGRVNNWDIVDSSAHFIVGPYVEKHPSDILVKLAHSDNLWQRRVAMISTFHFLRSGDPDLTLQMAEILLHDKHDLIQKAVGWALREMGKHCDTKLLTDFLDRHAATMPRTSLRYAIEHLGSRNKRGYMNKKLPSPR